jgi:hypothetical protein
MPQTIPYWTDLVGDLGLEGIAAGWRAQVWLYDVIEAAAATHQPQRDRVRGMRADVEELKRKFQVIQPVEPDVAWMIVGQLQLWRIVDWDTITERAYRRCSTAAECDDLAADGKCLREPHVECAVLPDDPNDLAHRMVNRFGARIINAVDDWIKKHGKGNEDG